MRTSILAASGLALLLATAPASADPIADDLTQESRQIEQQILDGIRTGAPTTQIETMALKLRVKHTDLEARGTPRSSLAALQVPYREVPGVLFLKVLGLSGLSAFDMLKGAELHLRQQEDVHAR